MTRLDQAPLDSIPPKFSRILDPQLSIVQALVLTPGRALSACAGTAIYF